MVKEDACMYIKTAPTVVKDTIILKSKQRGLIQNKIWQSLKLHTNSDQTVKIFKCVKWCWRQALSSPKQFWRRQPNVWWNLD